MQKSVLTTKTTLLFIASEAATVHLVAIKMMIIIIIYIIIRELSVRPSHFVTFLCNFNVSWYKFGITVTILSQLDGSYFISFTVEISF